MENITIFFNIAFSIIVLYFCYLVVQLSVDAHKRAIVAGKEALIGEEATVVSAHHGKIMVRLLGELWEAESPMHVHLHQRVKVIKLKGLKLTVKPIDS